MMGDSPYLGLRLDVPSEEYHRQTDYVSKSMLDLVHQSPSLLLWSRDAPVDEEVEKAVDMGNAFEALLLEPERFAATYAQAPQVDRRTKDGKAAATEFEQRCAAEGLEPLTHDQWRQVHFMRDSTMAHPVARRAFEAAALTQASFYWRDEDTGLLCRCRPDFMLENVPFVIDVKTSADMKTFRRSMVDFRWFVQDSFYSDGLSKYYGGEHPSFVFLVTFTSRSAGRYPVHAFEFKADAKHAGRDEYRDDLQRYKECVRNDDWVCVEGLDLPSWYWASRG